MNSLLRYSICAAPVTCSMRLDLYFIWHGLQDSRQCCTPSFNSLPLSTEDFEDNFKIDHVYIRSTPRSDLSNVATYSMKIPVGGHESYIVGHMQRKIFN